LKIGICEDEQRDMNKAIQLIQSYGEKRSLNFEIIQFVAAKDLVKYMQEVDYFDILFIDIYLPTNQGLALARSVREFDTNCAIVFTTSSKDHAVDSYSVRAIDYLLKPLTESSVNAALDRAIEEYSIKHWESVIVQNKQGTYKICLRDIFYAESNARVISIHTQTQGVIRLYDRLDNFQANCMHDSFYRCHKSYLVNLDYARSLEKNSFILKNGTTIPITVKINEAKQAFLQYKARKL
jgi:two-component system response regulator LytT